MTWLPPSRSHTASVGSAPNCSCPLSPVTEPLFSHVWMWKEFPPCQVAAKGVGADKAENLPGFLCQRVALTLILGPGPVGPGVLSLPGRAGRPFMALAIQCFLKE